MNGFKAAPRLNRKLTLESPVHTPDGAGGQRQTWNALGVIWAQIDAGSGRETTQGDLPLSAVPLRITLRAAPVGSSMRPMPDQRFREGARLYHIKAVVEGDARARYLTCYATEEVVTR